MNTTTTTAAPTRPSERKPLRARNTAIAALAIVSAMMVAAGVAVASGNPVPPLHPAASAAPADSWAVTISPSSLGRNAAYVRGPAGEVTE